MENRRSFTSVSATDFPRKKDTFRLEKRGNAGARLRPRSARNAEETRRRKERKDGTNKLEQLTFFPGSRVVHVASLKADRASRVTPDDGRSLACVRRWGNPAIPSWKPNSMTSHVRRAYLAEKSKPDSLSRNSRNGGNPRMRISPRAKMREEASERRPFLISFSFFIFLNTRAMSSPRLFTRALSRAIHRRD